MHSTSEAVLDESAAAPVRHAAPEDEQGPARHRLRLERALGVETYETIGWTMLHQPAGASSKTGGGDDMSGEASEGGALEKGGLGVLSKAATLWDEVAAVAGGRVLPHLAQPGVTAVAAGIAAMKLFGLAVTGVETIGQVPTGLPSLTLPGLALVDQLWVPAVGIALMSFVETIAAGLSEPRDAIEEIIEPYLLQQGFIARTPRGRVLTQSAFAHLGLQAPDRPAQFGLFNGGDE
jgi:hypothetical protein